MERCLSLSPYLSLSVTHSHTSSRLMTEVMVNHPSYPTIHNHHITKSTNQSIPHTTAINLNIYLSQQNQPIIATRQTKELNSTKDHSFHTHHSNTHHSNQSIETNSSGNGKSMCVESCLSLSPYLSLSTTTHETRQTKELRQN